MSEVRQAGDTDRLPWLEPYRDRPAVREGRPAPAAVAAPNGRRVSVPLWLIVLIGAAAMAVAGYLIGRQSTATGPTATTELPRATLPYRSVDELANEQMPPPPPAIEDIAPEPVGAAPIRTENPTKGTTAKASPPRKPVVRRAAPKPPAAQRPQQSPPRATPAQPQRPRFVQQTIPPRYVGRSGHVIELGRYTNTRYADRAFRHMVWRYPYLGKLARTVTPSAAVRNRRVYALRLGAGSRRNAKALCKNIQSIGYPCAVV